MKLKSLIFYHVILTVVAAQRHLQCGQTSYSKQTVLENSRQIPDSCQYTIEAYSSHTCQLLIRFEKFGLQQPTLRNGVLECVDYLTVGDFILCGDNAEQHLYIAIDGTAYTGRTGRVTLRFQLNSRWASSHWRLVVTQLECAHTPDIFRLSNIPGLRFLQNLENTTRTLFSNSYLGDLDLIAPRGCHQYFTERTGTIRSFNYNATYGTLYMPNLSYVICVKAAEGVQKIDYSAESFSMSVAEVSSAGFDLDCYSLIVTIGRRADFLMIPQSTLPNLPAFRPTHYCGRSLDKLQVIASVPFLIYFQSDNLADPTETGFVIHYSVK